MLNKILDNDILIDIKFLKYIVLLLLELVKRSTKVENVSGSNSERFKNSICIGKMFFINEIFVKRIPKIKLFIFVFSHKFKSFKKLLIKGKFFELKLKLFEVISKFLRDG